MRISCQQNVLQKKICKRYSSLKLVILAHLHVAFFLTFFINHKSFKSFYLPMKLLPPLNKEINMKCLAIKTTLNSKNIIATLRIVAIGKPELKFFLLLYFHDLI